MISLRTHDLGSNERMSRRRSRIGMVACAAIAIGLPLTSTVLVSAGPAGAKGGNKSTAGVTAAATATVSPSVVTWGLAGNDVIMITATGLKPGGKYYEQVQSLQPAGTPITFVIPFSATSTGGVPAPWNSWEMNDPYNASQTPPPTWSGPAEVVITSNASTNGWALSSTPVATAPFTILPGQNTLMN